MTGPFYLQETLTSSEGVKRVIMKRRRKGFFLTPRRDPLNWETELDTFDTTAHWPGSQCLSVSNISTNTITDALRSN